MQNIISKNLRKLATHEDPYHIHKIFGFLSLLNFIYQLAMYFYLGKMYKFNNWAYLPNIVLPITSFIFNVLPKKKANGTMGLFIWKEMRLHVLIFSTRGIITGLFPEYAFFSCIGTMIAADIATYFYGTNGATTLRSDHTKSSTLLEKFVKGIYATSQFGATIICSGLFQKQVSQPLAFMTILPIQTSAFLMTLVRKNIIGVVGWNIVYSLELLLLYVMWYTEYNNLNVLFISSLVYLSRPHMSKYVIWSSLYLTHIYFTTLYHLSFSTQIEIVSVFLLNGTLLFQSLIFNRLTTQFNEYFLTN